MKYFAVIGGDERSRYTARYLKNSGAEVCCCGLGRFDEFNDTDINSALEHCDIVVFPPVPTKDGINLFAPLKDEEIRLDSFDKTKLKEKRIYSGKSPEIAKAMGLTQCEVFGYDKLESFLTQNARITAEAALMLAIKESPKAIYKSSCLVAGYGRIGTILCKMLDSLGAQVTVSEIDEKKLNSAKMLGYKAARKDKQEEFAHPKQFIFNTCVADIITSAAAEKLPKDTLIIDVASAPGGCDYAACDKYGIKYIKALGLPGKYSPRSAGEIIAQTILNIEEGREWKEKG